MGLLLFFKCMAFVLVCLWVGRPRRSDPPPAGRQSEPGETPSIALAPDQSGTASIALAPEGAHLRRMSRSGAPADPEASSARR